MRIFAGPNGSGKSTIFDSVRSYKTESVKIDFGIYINTDEILVQLKSHKFSFKSYQVNTTKKEFQKIALDSGLINKSFTEKEFNSSYAINGQKLRLIHSAKSEELAQIIADFLRKKLVNAEQKFSFETVFSHPSKLQIMKDAIKKGYKVYLYFVSTSSPELNKERVKLRVKLGGHSVPEDKIESRYFRSLDLLYEASQLRYQTFFWDNSGKKPFLFANFKMMQGSKNWKIPTQKKIPDWFFQYYINKIS
jgi:predicted ABC-type ATPase